MLLKAKPNVRYRIVQDHDAHWYIIQSDQYQLFLDWVEYMESETDKKYNGFDFDKVRINQPNDVDIFDFECEV